jgi:hypothetical protein
MFRLSRLARRVKEFPAEGMAQVEDTPELRRKNVLTVAGLLGLSAGLYYFYANLTPTWDKQFQEIEKVKAARKAQSEQQ